jgi:hypothetical protein
MSRNNNSQNLNELLTCKVCRKYFLNPLILPCGNHICEMDVNKKLTEKSTQIYKCDFCFKDHEAPENGFIQNRLLIDLLNMNLHLDSKTKTTQDVIDDLDSLNKEINVMVKDPEDFIYSYFSKEKNKIDLKRETSISKINDISDEMIKNIKQLELDSKSNLSEKKQNLIDPNKFDFKTLTDKVFSWNEEIRNPLLEKSRLDEITEESINLLKENQSQSFDAKNKILNKKGCYFIPNKKEFKSEFFGELIIDDFSITHQRKNSDSSPIKFDSNILNFNHSTELIRLCEFQDKKEFKLLYRASRDGFSSEAFHSKCDNIPKTLTIIKVKDKPHIFGGYTQATWEGRGYKQDPNAFIFSLVNSDNKPIKMKISNQNIQYAIYCGPSYVSFLFAFGGGSNGGFDFVIYSDSNNNSKSFSYLGYSYQHPNYQKGSNEAKSFLAGSYNFSTSEIEVFQLI